jgi:hypothetical protein
MREPYRFKMDTLDILPDMFIYVEELYDGKTHGDFFNVVIEQSLPSLSVVGCLSHFLSNLAPIEVRH